MSDGVANLGAVDSSTLPTAAEANDKLGGTLGVPRAFVIWPHQHHYPVNSGSLVGRGLGSNDNNLSVDGGAAAASFF